MNITEASAKYHWLKIADDGVVEMYLDHHALSQFRMCEAKFELEILHNIRGKGRAWALEFGIIVHEVMEYFYKSKELKVFDLTKMLELAKDLWQQRNMEEFKEHHTYKALAGLPGLMLMLSQYAQFFAADNDNLRPIGLEVPFGKNKEVPLGEFTLPQGIMSCSEPWHVKYTSTVRCYLTGRIDFLMDSGTAIGPMDHKTTAFFKGDPTDSHDPQEGMTGYVYAVNKIIQTQFPEFKGGRKCDRVWMNYIQVKAEEDFRKRFRRVPIFKSEFQLEQYRLRQLRTFEKIFDLVINDKHPDWNTNVCNNMFHAKCPFFDLHSQTNPDAMLTILKHDFQEEEPWNPERM